MTFVIEQKFGFNKTTPKTFITDIIKGLLLSVSLGIPLLAGILAFFQYAGALAWLYCWMVTVVFSLAIQYIAPTWIMPLFNKFTPLADGELKKRIMAYARLVEYKVADIYVMDGSKRSSKSNAFFTGFGKNRRIALFDTLIDKHKTEEMVGILAHEIGHFKKKHILKMQITGIIHTGVLFLLLQIFLTQQGLFNAFGMDTMPLYAGFVFFGLLYKPIELIISMAMNAISRRHEYEADQFACITTKDSESLVAALKKLSLNNLSNLTPHWLIVFLEYSHPPILDRIKAIKKVG
jgi:STE24 endopeptidase